MEFANSESEALAAIPPIRWKEPKMPPARHSIEKKYAYGVKRLTPTFWENLMLFV